MKILIVESNAMLGGIWGKHIERLGGATTHASSQAEAILELSREDYDVVVLNLALGDGSAIAVTDYANYRRPKAKVIFVNSDSFFSAGSIFSFMSNACALVPPATSPEDIAELVNYHGR